MTIWEMAYVSQAFLHRERHLDLSDTGFRSADGTGQETTSELDPVSCFEVDCQTGHGFPYIVISDNLSISNVSAHPFCALDGEEFLKHRVVTAVCRGPHPKNAGGDGPREPGLTTPHRGPRSSCMIKCAESDER